MYTVCLLSSNSTCCVVLVVVVVVAVAVTAAAVVVVTKKKSLATAKILHRLQVHCESSLCCPLPWHRAILRLSVAFLPLFVDPVLIEQNLLSVAHSQNNNSSSQYVELNEIEPQNEAKH